MIRRKVTGEIRDGKIGGAECTFSLECGHEAIGYYRWSRDGFYMKPKTMRCRRCEERASDAAVGGH